MSAAQFDTSSISITRRKQFLLGLAIIGIILELIYLPLNLSNKQYFLATTNIIGLLIAITLIIYLRKAKNVNIIANIIMFIALINSINIFINHDKYFTSLFYYFPFIPQAFFLTGKKGGILWSLLLSLFLLFSLVLKSKIHAFDIPQPVLFELVVGLIFTGIIIFLFQDITEKNEKIILQKNKELSEAARHIQEELTERENAQEALRQSNREIAKFNKYMVERELKMTQLEEENDKLRQKILT